MNYLISIIFCLLSFTCLASDLSSWESKVDIPENVLKLKNIKDKRSTEYEMTSYEAAMDLAHLAKAQMKIGNTVKSLHFISLAAKLFPYRDDIVNTYRETLDEYTSETNSLIKAKRLSCDDLKQRIFLLSSLSPKSVQTIDQKNVSCEIKIEHSYKSIADIDISQWMTTSLPKNQQYSKSNDSDTGDSIYLQAMKAKAKKLEIKRLADKVYTLRFPKLEIILSALKVLGNFSLDTAPEVYTDDNGNTYLRAFFNISTDSISYGFDGHCNSIEKFFKLPSEYSYGSIVGSHYICGMDYSSSKRDTLNRSVFSNWSFSDKKILVMKEGIKYNSDSSKSNKPLYMFFPKKLDMYVQYNYKDRPSVTKTFMFEIDNLTNFMYWFNIGNLETIEPPKIIVNNANITLTSKNLYSIPIKDLKSLQGLKSLEIKFDAKKTFDRLVKELEVKRL